MKKIDADDPMGKSADVAGDNFQLLRELFPEAFSEGRLDMQILRQLVGDLVVDEPTDAAMPDEKYGLNWKGKRRARQLALTPSLGTLRPCPDESVDWDTTKNLMIEGDNLEVLKLLQKSYSGRIKLIYIDPPYNTGKDFVYPDNFHDNIRNYLELTGQIDGEGRRLTSNPESSGRFHTDWLNMMYPRLKLARNLLREDGAIFVSIADHEIHNLRSMMDEIFGPENFIATVIWQKVYAPKSSAKHFSEDHDYVLVYALHGDVWSPSMLARTDEQNAVYRNYDNDPRGPWRPNNLAARNLYSKGTYSIQCPGGRLISGPPSGSYWRVSEEKFRELDRDNRIWWGAEGNNVPAPKIFLSEVKAGRVPQTLWTYQEVGHTQQAKKELLSLVEFPNSDAVFDTPKPTKLIRRILQIATDADSDCLVLDFFGGSGTTMQSVMEENAQDGGNRRCVLVQIAEPLPGAKEQALATIMDVAKMRVVNAGGRIRDELQTKTSVADDEATKKDNGLGLFDRDEDASEPDDFRIPDLGFRVFKLDTSNIRVWNPDPSRFGEELLANAEHVLPDRNDGDLLYEMLLKLGLDLTESIVERTIAGMKVMSIGNGALMACLEKVIDASIVEELAKGIAAWHAEQAPAGETTVFFRDSAFADDVAKSNLTAILEQTFQGRKKDIRIRSI